MRLVLLLSLFFLSACHGLAVEPHEMQAYPDIPDDAQPSPIGFNQLKWAIPTGTSMASTSPKGLFGIFVCGSPYTTMQRNALAGKVSQTRMKDAFNHAMEMQGYDVTGGAGRLFDEEEDLMRTIFSIGGRITNIRMDVCDRKSFLFGYDRGFSGEGEVEIEWTIYDKLHRRNIYKTTTKGYANLGVANYEGIELIIEEAVGLAAHNLGADPHFRDLIVYGEKPPGPAPKTIQDINEAPMGKFDPDEAVRLPTLSPFNSRTAPPLDQWTKTTVLIQSGASGHGSGFFITKDGHILTNAHVVGNAFQVRVVTSGKKEKQTAEVLRLDRLRDVALLRLENPPANIAVHPIQIKKPAVGQDIYAIGAPLRTKLQDTLTKGIVSAHRYDRYRSIPLIQGDVGISGGNSGGPLLDEFGNIVGLSVSGYGGPEKYNTGLNNFIPIEDALNKLDVYYSH